MIDVAEIKVKGGDGGDGAVSFRREKYIAKGGPDGGDGGDGGDVYIITDTNKATLMDFKARPNYEAGNGDRGGGKNMSGLDGDDLTIKVPLGTLIYQVSNGEELLVGDMNKPDQKLLIANGGKGGKGNNRFKSSRNRTPVQFTRGTDGEVRNLKLEIKVMADVGLIGLPNAGKSTLINQLSNANARVANYPFTTLSPNLGSVTLKSGKVIIIADIPGLIEGASTGKGLGDEFLRHVERTRVLVHLIDAISEYSGESPIEEYAWNQYRVIRKELGDYNEELLDKPELAIINKVDITEVKEALPKIISHFKDQGVEVFGMSGVTGEGIEEFKQRLMEELDKNPDKKEFVAQRPTKVYNIRTLPSGRFVFRSDVEERKL